MNTNSGVDWVSAPADYAALHRQYYTFVVTLVRRYVKGPDIEDVASEILLRFLQRDFLAKFDPSLVFEHDGQRHPARFKHFLGSFVKSYVRGMADKLRTVSGREPLLCDTLVGDEEQHRWIDVYGKADVSHEDDVVEELGETAIVAHLRRYLATVPQRSSGDICDLVDLFDAMIAQVRAFGEYNTASLAEHFDVSVTAMHTWIWWLKDNLACAMDRSFSIKRPQGDDE